MTPVKREIDLLPDYFFQKGVETNEPIDILIMNQVADKKGELLRRDIIFSNFLYEICKFLKAQGVSSND